MHRSPRLLALLTLSALSFMIALPGCEPDRRSASPDLSLLPRAAEPEDESTEYRRLRNLQMVTATHWFEDSQGELLGEKTTDTYPVLCAPGVTDCANANGKTKPSLATLLFAHCGQLINCADAMPDESITTNPAHCTEPTQCCRSMYCAMRLELCIAHVLAEAAEPRVQPLLLKAISNPTGPEYSVVEVTPQGTATNVQLQRASAELARSATNRADAALRGSAWPSPSVSSVPNLPSVCTDLDMALAIGTGEGTAADAFSNGFVEAYETARVAFLAASRLSLDFAEAQRGSTPSRADAARREFSNPALSRAAAAALLTSGYLVGGSAHAPLLSMPAEITDNLCTSPEISPDVRQALDIMRLAALPPNDILSDEATRPTASLVNGNKTQYAAGSVLVRLTQLLGRSIPGGSIPGHFGLTWEHFREARDYLRSEIRAFARSSAELPPLPLPQGGTTTETRYAATASPPVALPGVYYATLLRRVGNQYLTYGGTEDLVGAFNGTDQYHSFPVTLGNSLAEFEDYTATRAAEILKFQGGIPEASRSAVVTPLATLLATIRTVRPGHLVMERLVDLSYRAIVTGYRIEEDIRLVLGEDGLRCATTGTIEGAPCDLPGITWKVLAGVGGGEQPSLYEFTAQEFGQLLTPTNPPPPASVPASPAPGTRVYLVRRRQGASAGPGGYEALTGVALPNYLGNRTFIYTAITPELDKEVGKILAPSPEWCTRAKESCAGETFDARLPLENELSEDSDGTESSWRGYLALARQAADEADLLGQDYLTASLESDRRREDVALRKDVQRQRAEGELETVQHICGTALDANVLLDRLSGSSRDLSELNPLPCTTDADCGESQRCTAGTCIVDLAWAAAEYPDDPDMQRLAECLAPDAIVPFAVLGDRDLCIWTDTQNPNAVCNGATATNKCPSVWPETGCPAPPAGNTGQVIWTRLNFFKTLTAPGVGHPCDDIRSIRRGQDVTDALARIRATNTLTPVHILENKLRFERRFQGHFALRVGETGTVRYQSGSAWTGGNATGWPCSVAVSNCLPNGTDPSLFCQSINCNSTQQRATMWARLEEAATALTVIRPDGKLPVTDVYYNNWPLPNGRNDPTVSTQWLPGLVPVQALTVNNYTHYDYSPANFVDSPSGVVSLPGTSLSGEDLFFHEGGWIRREGESRLSGALDGMSHVVDGWGYYYRSANSLHVPNVAHRVEFGHTNTVSRAIEAFSPSSRSMWDAPELSCDARWGSLGTCDAAAMPAVNSAADLDKVGEFMQCLGATIEDKAALAILPMMPRRAFDAFVQEGYSGSFPAVGGLYGQELTNLRGGLLRIKEVGPLLANEIRQIGYDIAGVKLTIERLGIQKEIQDVQFLSQMTSQIASCASGVVGAASIFSAAQAAIGCANAVAQVGFAKEIRNLAKEDLDLAEADELNEFAARFGDRVTATQSLSLSLAGGVEQAQRSLAALETLRLDASRAMSRALWAGADSATMEGNVTAAMLSRYATTGQRYFVAHRNAIRMAFIAKRAIENRLGLHLSSLTEDMPLVEAPSRWESTLCSSTGLKLMSYGTVSQEARPASYADAFVGDYVTKLENLLESYRMAESFQDGTDTAIASLRDDIMNVRAPCKTPVNNLLYHSSRLDFFSDDTSEFPGWTRTGCLTSTTGGETQVVQNCIRAEEVQGGTPPPRESAIWPEPPPFRVVAGDTGSGTCTSPGSCGYLAGSRVIQPVALKEGEYRVSWYAKDSSAAPGAAGVNAVQVLLGCTQAAPGAPQQWDCSAAQVASALAETVGYEELAESWERRYMRFAVPGEAVVAIAIPFTSSTLQIAGIMLEDVSSVRGLPNFDGRPASYANTTAELSMDLPVCEDSDGKSFRQRWRAGCVNLCSDGFGDCTTERATSHCYHEASFSISQKAIEDGVMFAQSGFARGNFNYRLDSVGLNFVGTARDCEQSDLPITCHGAGYIPYSLYHHGPFLVRNHRGEDFPVELFPGRIEHARGLATERYLTNPLSGSDSALIEQYMRTEFQGRPLDGNFAIRIWDEDGVDFNAIQDVQVVLKYRYWTRNN